jgi:nucleotide-binding universal stress UspA family protein
VFRNVLLALDFSAAADRALTEAIAVAERHCGRLTILTAIPEVRGWGGGPVETVTAANELNQQLERDAFALQQKALERVPQCMPVKTIIRRAPVRRALLEALAEGCYDGLVLGASGAGRVRVSRSLTRCMIRRSGIAVLVADADDRPAKLHVPQGGPAISPGPELGLRPVVPPPAR